MIIPRNEKVGDFARNLMFVRTPALWQAWPFLPVVRRAKGVQELGVMFDALNACEVTGYSAAVFLTNMFVMPSCLHELLKLPREVYDCGEEVVAAGWAVN